MTLPPTLQLAVVPVVDMFLWLLSPADEAVLVPTLHVPVQVIAVVEALAAEVAVGVALQWWGRSCMSMCVCVCVRVLVQECVCLLVCVCVYVYVW